MGFITSVLPILYILTKPAIGYLIDAFPVSQLCLNNACALGDFPTFRLISTVRMDQALGLTTVQCDGAKCFLTLEYAKSHFYDNRFSQCFMLWRILLCAIAARAPNIFNEGIDISDECCWSLRS